MSPYRAKGPLQMSPVKDVELGRLSRWTQCNHNHLCESNAMHSLICERGRRVSVMEGDVMTEAESEREWEDAVTESKLILLAPRQASKSRDELLGHEE